MAHRKPINSSRRKVLKTLGATSVVSSGFVVTGAASRGSKVVGVAYNPYTHEILGEASAQFNQNSDKLVGNLNIDGRKYRIDQKNTHSNFNYPNKNLNIRSFREVKKPMGQKKKKGKYNEMVKVMVPDNGNITGFVRSPESLERTGFTLSNERNGKYDSLLNTLEKTEKGEQ